MKPELPKLPSVAELLQHPTLQTVVQRVNQSTIAQRTTGFLDELKQNLRNRSEPGIVPTISQLAERLASRLLGKTRQASPVINATGVVLGDAWSTLPLAETVIHQILCVAGEYQVDGKAAADFALPTLCELTGSESAWVAANLAGAKHLVAQQQDWNIDLAPQAGLVNPSEFGLAAVETIGDRLKSGADVVVVDGAGLLGGPSCGMVLGRRARIDLLAAHSLAPLLVADRLTLTALEATLDVYRKPDRAMHQIPVLQLLGTPQANLQQRAERLAPLMAEHSAVAEATALACQSSWCDTAANQSLAPSWAVSLKPKDLSVERFVDRLGAGQSNVLGRVEQDVVLLDLRSVFPRWDQQLVAAVGEVSGSD